MLAAYRPPPFECAAVCYIPILIIMMMLFIYNFIFHHLALFRTMLLGMHGLIDEFRDYEYFMNAMYLFLCATRYYIYNIIYITPFVWCPDVFPYPGTGICGVEYYNILVNYIYIYNILLYKISMILYYFHRVLCLCVCVATIII